MAFINILLELKEKFENAFQIPTSSVFVRLCVCVCVSSLLLCTNTSVNMNIVILAKCVCVLVCVLVSGQTGGSSLPWWSAGIKENVSILHGWLEHTRIHV